MTPEKCVHNIDYMTIGIAQCLCGKDLCIICLHKMEIAIDSKDFPWNMKVNIQYLCDDDVCTILYNLAR